MKERLKNFHHSAVFICLVLAIVLDILWKLLENIRCFKAISYVWNQPLIFLYNCSIIFFTLTLSLLMRKRIFGYCIISFAWLILGITNCIVLGFRITPFSAIDMLMARNTITIIDKYFNVSAVRTHPCASVRCAGSHHSSVHKIADGYGQYI